MPAELVIYHSSICNDFSVMRIPGWAIERAGAEGSWTNEDGETYVPFEMATIVKTFDTRPKAEAYLKTIS